MRKRLRVNVVKCLQSHLLLLMVPKDTFQSQRTHAHAHTQFFARLSNYHICLISLMNVQHILHGSSGVAGIRLRCCFSVAFLEQFMGDRDKEQPVRGPVCLRIMGTRVLRGPLRITKEIRHALRCKCVRYGACMRTHVRLYTCVRAEEKVGPADSAPKRGPLSSQTHSHAGLLSPHLSD